MLELLILHHKWYNPNSDTYNVVVIHCCHASALDFLTLLVAEGVVLIHPSGFFGNKSETAGAAMLTFFFIFMPMRNYVSDVRTRIHAIRTIVHDILLRIYVRYASVLLPYGLLSMHTFAIRI